MFIAIPFALTSTGPIVAKGFAPGEREAVQSAKLGSPARKIEAKVQPSMNKHNDASFKPGFGRTPPELAGRDDEMAAITEALDALEARSCPAANVALVGPRGNGKTVLLRWVQTQVDRRDNSIECAVLSADRFNSHHDLVDALADQSVFSALVREGFSSTIKLFGSEADFSRQGSAKNCLGPY